MSMLEGKAALVTGAAGGIGSAIAVLFAEHGATVGLTGRDRDALEAVASEIRAIGGEVVVEVADLTDLAAVERMRDAVEGRLGPVDVLVATAGGSPSLRAEIEDVSVEDWSAIVDRNLTSAFLTIKAFLGGMKQRRGGVIITFSSAGARVAGRSPAAYAAAKAGVEALTKHVAVEAGPFGIRVNCIAPDFVLTQRNLARTTEEIRDKMQQGYPLRRLGTPDDIASAALFLASDQSSWVTGITVDIAGGSHLAS